MKIGAQNNVNSTMVQPTLVLPNSTMVQPTLVPPNSTMVQPTLVPPLKGFTSNQPRKQLFLRKLHSVLFSL